MIKYIGCYGFIPDLTLTLDKDRYFEVNKNDIYLELNFLEQFILMKGIYNHFKTMPAEKVKEIIESYKDEQPEYMLEWVESFLKELENK